MLSFSICVFCFLHLTPRVVVGVPFSREINSDYSLERSHLMTRDESFMLGNDIQLSASEKSANKRLMQRKNEESLIAFENLDSLPGAHFFKRKHTIDNSEVFKFIKEMPKGAALHLHHQSMASMEWVISNITYWDDLYMCTTEEDHLNFKFFTGINTYCDWKLVSDVRKSYSTAKDFDDYLLTKLSMLTPFPEVAYTNTKMVWISFEKRYSSLVQILNYKEAAKAHLAQALKEFLQDNVIYLEFRGVLAPLYEKNGEILSKEETVEIYKNVIDEFVSENPSFYGVKYIYAPRRRATEKEISHYVDMAIRLKTLFPDFFLGFDLVGQEDRGKSLISVLPSLLKLYNHDPPIPLFFHAGETNYHGLSSDDNLFDALLLNVSRIGHGYSIAKHPFLMEVAIQNDIPIEVCPIANQIMMLVSDLRNHPASFLAAKAYPMIVSSDAPGLWGALPLSHDFYEAFVTIGGARADLKFLKKLAINSIKYSGLEDDKKADLMNQWIRKWSEFIDRQISDEKTLKMHNDEAPSTSEKKNQDEL